MWLWEIARFNSPIQLRVSLDSNYHSLEEKKAIDREKVTFYGILALNPVRFESVILRVYYTK